jgi:hypothetical protein
MRRLGWIVAAALVALPGAPASAQEQFFYPTKGQSAKQQEQDKFACYQWAKGQTGFDPMAAPTASTPRPQGGGGANPIGGALVGAGGGAALGAIGGAIAGGKAGKGAAIGSATGGLLGLMGVAGDNHRASKERKEWEHREASQYAASRGSYNRAFAACMQGRGYSVN